MSCTSLKEMKEILLTINKKKILQKGVERVSCMFLHCAFKSKDRVKFGSLLLNLLIKISAHCFLGPRLVVEVGLAFFLRIAGNIGHGLQV